MPSERKEIKYISKEKGEGVGRRKGEEEREEERGRQGKEFSGRGRESNQ